MRNGIATAPLGTLPPAPTRRSWRGRASGSRGVAAIAILAVCLGLVLTELQGEIVRLRGQGAEASAAAQTIAERLSTLAAGQASLATRVDGWFDPASIVPSAEPSVFTVIAGPVLGSAFVLSSAEERSMLVTNFHVVRAMWSAGLRRVVVRAEGRSFNATIVVVRSGADLAVLRVRSPLAVLETSPISPGIGQPVVVLGSPYGFGGTASAGIISAIRRRYLQFSAPVSPGSSGGPVLDGDGRVVGVATAKVVGRGAEGLSFAIPIDRVCRLTAVC